MKRITQLDGLRGIAILLVLMWHYVAVEVAVTTRAMSRCVQVLSMTWSGVDLFFVLSGFLIVGILLDHRESHNLFRVFYVRRACRIFPLYFLMIGSFCVLRSSAPACFGWLFQGTMPIWSYATFTQNILMGIRGDWGPHWLGITWSLAVEEQFYLCVPLLVRFLPRQALVCALIVGMVAAPLLRHLSPGFHVYVNTLWRADALLAGALLAVLVRTPAFLLAATLRRKFLLALLCALLVGFAALTRRPLNFGVFNYVWLAGLYSVLVLLAVIGREPVLRHVLESPALVWLGKLSYGIYMFHEAVNGILHGILRHGAPEIHNASDAGITLISVCLTLVLAAVSFRLLETPLLRFGHRFEYLPRLQTEPVSEAIGKDLETSRIRS